MFLFNIFSVFAQDTIVSPLADSTSAAVPTTGGGSSIELKNIIIGLVMPFVVDFVNRYMGAFDSKIKFIISWLLCIAVAAIVNIDELIKGDWGNFAGSAATVFVTAQGFYNLYWKNAQTRDSFLGAIDKGLSGK